MMSLALHKKRQGDEKRREDEQKREAKRQEKREKHAANTASTLHKRPERFAANDVSIRITQREKNTPVPSS